MIRQHHIQSLRSGVVPRAGLQYVAVGRPDEIQSLLRDVARIADGRSGSRFVIGEYGTGKTFLSASGSLGRGASQTW